MKKTPGAGRNLPKITPAVSRITNCSSRVAVLGVMSARRCSASSLELRIVLLQAIATGIVKKTITVENGRTLAIENPATQRYGIANSNV